MRRAAFSKEIHAELHWQYTRPSLPIFAQKQHLLNYFVLTLPNQITEQQFIFDMNISKNKVVALTYTLVVDGKVADQTTEANPLKFIFGMGYLLPKFEANIEGKTEGDTFEFTLTPEEGYGTHDPNKIIELPMSVFEVDGKVQEGLLTIGNVIPMMNNQGGVIPGTVAEVKADSVMMDFNSPMAGKTLNFTGKILAIREATEKELTEGLHGEFKQDSCGGGCSSCGGCGDGCECGGC